MDIRKTFGTDADLETEGVWVEIGDGARVRVARQGTAAHQKALERLRAPYRTILLSGRPLPPKVAEEITVKAMSECILLGWDGFTEDGAPLPYSRETADLLLSGVKDFRNVVAFLSSEGETFRRQAIKDAGGNSEPPLPGS